jgi:peptidoglycan/xylan/chitin deacetylase (PgdA/CDA1 family)
MYNISSQALQSWRAHPQVYFAYLGIVIMLTLILVISGSIPHAITGLQPLLHKAHQRHPHSGPVVVPTYPAPTPREVPLPMLDNPLYGGNTRLPEVALTFDDGPNPYYTPQVLAILQHYNVKATFFDVGWLVKTYPDIVRREFKAGHIVANHSWSHPLLTSLSAQAVYNQFVRTSAAIQAVTGVRPSFFRPPYGSYNSLVTSEAKSLGLSTIIWNDEARDWSLPGVGTIISRILNLTANGVIILLHDGGGFRQQTVAALPYIIMDLRSRGYTFVTIKQMIRHLTRLTRASPASVTTPQRHKTHPKFPKVAFILWKRESLLGWSRIYYS